jgi:hypothetical protein
MIRQRLITSLTRVANQARHWWDVLDALDERIDASGMMGVFYQVFFSALVAGLVASMWLGWLGPFHVLAKLVVTGSFTCLLTIAWPIVLYQRRKMVRQQWHRTGKCGVCGYDLRASKERCPECGRPTALKAESNA